jgi:Helix-turn-helix domain
MSYRSAPGLEVGSTSNGARQAGANGSGCRLVTVSVDMLSDSARMEVLSWIRHSGIGVRQNKPLLDLIDDRALISGVPVEEVIGRSHESRLVNIRRDVAKEARKRGYSLQAIGRALNRHHTTIIHLLRG